MGGRDEDCFYCPSCHNWRFVDHKFKMKKVKVNGKEIIAASWTECRCRACGHKWIEE